jgi:hypothetical protein
MSAGSQSGAWNAWRWRAFSCVKPDNDRLTAPGGEQIERANEDAWAVIGDDEQMLRLAVSDGAGGMGVYAAEWAKWLVDHLPAAPLRGPSNVDDWLATHWRAFYDAHVPDKQTNSFVSNKFFAEGSAATLAAVWALSDGTNFRVDWCAFGDSAVLIYRKREDRLLVPAHLNVAGAFDCSPHLINWADDHTSDGMYTATIEPNLLEPGDMLLVASDALSQSLWLRYHFMRRRNSAASAEMIAAITQNARKGAIILNALKQEAEAGYDSACFGDWLQAWLREMSDASAFQRSLFAWHEQGLLARDDYTLLIVEHAVDLFGNGVKNDI